MIESIIRRDGVWNLSHAFRWFPEHMPNKQLHWSTLPLKFSPGQTPFEYELLKFLRHNFMVEKFKHFGQVRKTPGAWALENDRNDEDLGDKQLIYFGSLSYSTLVICIFRILLWVKSFWVKDSPLEVSFHPGFFGLDWCQIWLLINKLLTRCGRQWRSAADDCLRQYP